MPSTATITAFYTFVAGTNILSARVNANFDVFRGHMCPVDPTVTSSLATSGAYDLGSADHYWRQNYNQTVVFAQVAVALTTPAAGFNSIYFKTDGLAYTKNSAGTESALGGSGGGALGVTGTAAAGLTITAAGGITYNTAGAARQMWHIIGDTTTGTDITANPQISAGSTLGQELIIVGTSDTLPVIFEDGTGLKLTASFTAVQYSTLYVYWNGSVWQEITRSVF
jgi:hypothetical protein